MWRHSVLLGGGAGQRRAGRSGRTSQRRRNRNRPFARLLPVRPPKRSVTEAKARPSSAEKAAADSSAPAIVATVNTQRITREDLARECLRHYGKEVLESMVNKHLIVAGVPAAGDQRHAGRGGRRDRAHGEAVQHSGRPVAEDAQAGAEHHARAVRQRHHLAHAGAAQDWPANG